MKSNARSEADIFVDLAKLTASPGYAYAIAQICHRDNGLIYSEALKPSDMERMFSNNRLIRTEVTTLLGLMMRQQLDLTVPSVDTVEAYVKRTDELMEELHHALSGPMHASLLAALAADNKADAPRPGEMMREPIFYATESAYSFQYRDLLPEKYGADDAWLVQNMGFTISQAQAIARAMCVLMDERATQVFIEAKVTKLPAEAWLYAFEYASDEIAQRSGEDMQVVEAFLKTFTLGSDNSQFQSVGDFNSVAATPLLPTGRGTVLLFQHYAIYEALYESPFFWMWADEGYRPTAMANRGAFTEQNSARRLAAVFGDANVHTNVNLHQGKNIVGEADVLVVFGDRIIIVQAKAKKLTLEARKGNDGRLKADFSAAIQKSYDQGWECANAIVAAGCRLQDDQGREVTLTHAIKEVFLFNVISDHYPALAIQAHEYLKYQSTDVIRPPFVMDVFLLDAMTEMLSTPLRLLSYVRMRLAVAGKVSLNHELTALAFHLRTNLWLDDEYNMVMLDDSIAADLDTAMMVRREGIAGERTPPGILTRMAGTYYEQLITQIEARPEAATLELGFILLSMGEDSCRRVHQGIEAITRQTQRDGMRHDFSIGLNGGRGICFHCNPAPSPGAVAALKSHCAKRKYKQRSPTWFGVSVGPGGDVQFGVRLDFPWSPSDEMEQITKGMKDGAPAASMLAALARQASLQKVGRNDPCPCGSGRKFKKCCLP
ncbi:preprotein translocase [Pseudomonas nicosulfuronedens]|uniref:Preprotein translocase n=1 Tax=Pseudomonas nicosulfuronedens TaxID=2571105 RepID=A0A5R9QLH6_9PSED|nr:SEC-C domain-containing protein [Pseudomonas nicosulfuronedens]TLX70041.1 preprotein translocase [Pseudomonas nicosulfuronedens]